jgi:hypothetical protein
MRNCVNTTYAAFAEVRKMDRHFYRFVASGPFVKELDGTVRGAPLRAQRPVRPGRFPRLTGLGMRAAVAVETMER